MKKPIDNDKVMCKNKDVADISAMGLNNPNMLGGQNPPLANKAVFSCLAGGSVCPSESQRLPRTFPSVRVINCQTPYLNKYVSAEAPNLNVRSTKMENALTAFDYKNNQIRTKIINDEPYFCGIDVCNAISIKNNRQVMARLQKGVINNDALSNGVRAVDIMTEGGKQSLSFISEPNLYKIVLQSRKLEAEPFVNWVCGEVLPTIRKTGQYVNPQSDLGLVPVHSYARRKPLTRKKEVTLSQKARQEVGGIVKGVVHKAMEDFFQAVFPSDTNTVVTDLSGYYNVSDKEMMDTFIRWYGTRNLAHLNCIRDLGQEKEQLQFKLMAVQKAMSN